MNQLQLIFRIPAATDPMDVVEVLRDGGIPAGIPPNGIMPASALNSGSALIHTLCYTDDFEAIQTLTMAQRPVWQIFYAGEMFPHPNPEYDPEDEDSERFLAVVEHVAMNPSVWQFIPDQILYDENGNETGSEPVTQLHQWQGGHVLRKEA